MVKRQVMGVCVFIQTHVRLTSQPEQRRVMVLPLRQKYIDEPNLILIDRINFRISGVNLNEGSSNKSQHSHSAMQ